VKSHFVSASARAEPIIGKAKIKLALGNSPKAAILAVDRRSQARSAFQANLIFLKPVSATVFLSETLQIAGPT
jgi:hypothetical protein